MRLLKSIQKIVQLSNPLNHTLFSTKKSSEQTAYYNHRVESLPDFSTNHTNLEYLPVKPTITVSDFLQKYSQKDSIP